MSLRRYVFPPVVILCLALSATVVWAGALPEPEPLSQSQAQSQSQALYQQQCSSCHGAEARGTDIAPSLAGQQAPYLARQMEHFQAGIRGADANDAQGALMAATASTVFAALSDEQQQGLMAYLSELTPAASPLATEGDLRQGANYYNASCGGCHGGKAEGNAMMNAPRLAGLSGDYIKRQYQHFAEGIRGSDQSDRFGRQMKMMATTLPDNKTLTDVIAFITAQP